MEDRTRVVKVSALAGAALGAGVAIGVGLRAVLYGAAFGLGLGLALGLAADARRRLRAPKDELEEAPPMVRPFELADHPFASQG
jgi:hypothetical protein